LEKLPLLLRPLLLRPLLLRPLLLRPLLLLLSHSGCWGDGETGAGQTEPAHPCCNPKADGKKAI
jgi:hypothetical protein